MIKRQTFLFVLLMAFAFTGCKNNKSIDSLELVTPVLVDNSFKVILKAIVTEDDDFALYYTEDNSINFFDVTPIWQAVKGSQGEQDITFVLPDDAKPTQIRFDLGLNKNQEDVVIKGVKMIYIEKTFEAFGPNFFQYFRADENQCSADIDTGIIKSVITNSQRKTPSIYPHQDILGPELVKLLQ